VRKIEQQLANQISWAASSAITPINLPNEQIITRLDIDWAINLNVAGSAAYNALALPKCTWNQFGIQGGPSFFVNMTSPSLLLVQNATAHGGIVQDAVNTASNATFAPYFRQRIHFGSYPFGIPNPAADNQTGEGNIDNPFDYTAAIIGPTFAKGGLVLTMTNPANTVAGTNITINSTTVGKIIVYGILATNQELAAMNVAQPSFTETDLALSSFGTSTGLQSRQDLPVGQYVRRISTLLLDNGSGAAAAPDDTRISSIGVVVSGEGDRRIFNSDWYPYRNRTAMQLGNSIVSQRNTPTAGEVNPGFGSIDMRSHVDVTDPRATDARKFGANLVGQQAGNYQLALSVATANGTLQLLYEQLKPAMAAPTVPVNAQGAIAPGAQLAQLPAGR
jgi:hypothetical protein